MKKNVLIYPGNSYSAQQVYFCLRDGLRYRPILGNHGKAHCEFYTDDCYLKLPLITDPIFFDELNQFIVEEQIEFIIPTHDTVADFLTQNQEKINACIVCSCKETTNICRHKKKTYEQFGKYDFVPQIYSLTDDIDFPIFIKDDVGQGGKFSYLIKSKEELEERLSNSNIDYVLTEYLPGEEITVDCFTNKYQELLFFQPRLRETILTGMSGRAKVFDATDEITEMARIINSEMHFRGYWYFQCKKDCKGKYKLMEISTRFAGTFCLTKNLDVNFPLLALSDFDGINVKIVPNKYDIVTDRGYINRYKVNYEYDRVYLDLDDTLISGRKKYILPTITFLYQCLNENKEIILLSRHAYDIHETLEKLFLDTRIFSKIIEVASDKKKSDYIEDDVPCIFVDNSFAERIDVKQKKCIPTFDVNNIECLLKAIV